MEKSDHFLQISFFLPRTVEINKGGTLFSSDCIGAPGGRNGAGFILIFVSSNRELLKISGCEVNKNISAERQNTTESTEEAQQYGGIGAPERKKFSEYTPAPSIKMQGAKVK
ncbi:unnamed protein product [Ceratitis capitata]|uniref:(Mediterranean fruit fly) hypothetical protein n=1 Tax=Ceratitis capitata TaxID=7213 RepID=A0A811UVE8_CERCA|nr:unnamed protein product [Ceratitis capitata]